MSDPPYRIIYQKLMSGDVIPFLGAGAPLYNRDPRVTRWYQAQAGKDVVSHLPTAGELARYLALNANPNLPDSEKGELTKMAQYFEAVVGDRDLREMLNRVFSHQEPTPLHDFLASLPAPIIIVTTNYDDLMERAFRAQGKPYDVVTHMTNQNKVLWWPHGRDRPESTAPQDLLIDLSTVSVIYKMHGAIDRRANEVGHYVITEDDYVAYLTRMTRKTVIPNLFAKPFQQRPFLFLGYGLYDWNLRVVLNGIQEFRRYPKFRSWAIETLPKPVERRLWELRGVEVFDGLTLEQFLINLKKESAPPPAGAPAAAAGV